ncbi:hypothetical protein OQA88_5119 [Cercophora sp. LCS_1]
MKPSLLLFAAPFKLLVQSDNPSLNNRIAQVCNLEFHIGEAAETCVYCYNAPPQYVCSTYGNETVLLSDGAMAADVPGGQYWFIDPPSGRLRTTGAGKAGGYGREWAGKGVTVHEDGRFEYEGFEEWRACLQGSVHGIFVPESEVRDGCEEVRLVAVEVERRDGAYAYT